MEYDEIMNMVIDELTELGFREQRKENAEVDNLIKKRVELSEQVQNCTAALDERTKQIIEFAYRVVNRLIFFLREVRGKYFSSLSVQPPCFVGERSRGIF